MKVEGFRTGNKSASIAVRIVIGHKSQQLESSHTFIHTHICVYIYICMAYVYQHKKKRLASSSGKRERKKNHSELGKLKP